MTKFERINLEASLMEIQELVAIVTEKYDFHLKLTVTVDSEYQQDIYNEICERLNKSAGHRIDAKH